MHSSRMPTAHCSGRHQLYGGWSSVPVGVSILGGPHCGQTDACEIITFPKLRLRPVKTSLSEEKPFNGIESCSNVIIKFVPILAAVVFAHSHQQNHKSFKFSSKNYIQCRIIVKITIDLYCLAQPYLLDHDCHQCSASSRVVFKLICRPWRVTKTANFINRISMERIIMI